jgi:hypothetical protein
MASSHAAGPRDHFIITLQTFLAQIARLLYINRQALLLDISFFPTTAISVFHSLVHSHSLT